jgi:acyl CoA:acetate/3-ketoacid CoA transferase alpha subunit
LALCESFIDGALIFSGHQVPQALIHRSVATEQHDLLICQQGAGDLRIDASIRHHVGRPVFIVTFVMIRPITVMTGDPTKGRSPSASGGHVP